MVNLTEMGYKIHKYYTSNQFQQSTNFDSIHLDFRISCHVNMQYMSTETVVKMKLQENRVYLPVSTKETDVKFL